MSATQKIMGHFYAIFTILVWGSCFVLTKEMLTTYTAIQIIPLRMALAYVTLWVLRPKTLKLPRKDELMFILIGVTGGSLYFFLQIMVIPLAPDRTLVRTKWLVHKDAVEGVDYDLHKLTSVWTATTEQDAALVTRSQAGVTDPSYEPGPYSRFCEGPLDDFATWYVQRMKAHGY